MDTITPPLEPLEKVQHHNIAKRLIIILVGLAFIIGIAAYTTIRVRTSHTPQIYKSQPTQPRYSNSDIQADINDASDIDTSADIKAIEKEY